MQLCTCYGMYAEVRGQFQGVSSLLPPRRTQESNSDCQVFTQSPPPGESPCQPHCVWWDRFSRPPGAGLLDWQAWEPYRLPTLPPQCLGCKCALRFQNAIFWRTELRSSCFGHKQVTNWVISFSRNSPAPGGSFGFGGFEVAKKEELCFFFPLTLAFSNIHLGIYSFFS